MQTLDQNAKRELMGAEDAGSLFLVQQRRHGVNQAWTGISLKGEEDYGAGWYPPVLWLEPPSTKNRYPRLCKVGDSGDDMEYAAAELDRIAAEWFKDQSDPAGRRRAAAEACSYEQRAIEAERRAGRTAVKERRC